MDINIDAPDGNFLKEQKKGGMMSRARFSDRVLSQFQPGMAGTLLEFGKYLRTIDADYLIFMARKSLRLYDLLTAIGLPQVERPVLSDRVLAQNATLLSGKRVALIDDTLILGTSLLKAKSRLNSTFQAEVTCHVLCADKKLWPSDVITPDKIFAELDHDELMTFCTSEVNALALAAIPYLVDFPFSKPVRIKLRDLSAFLSIPNWNVYKLSSEKQEADGAYFYSLLPTETTCLEIENALGPNVYSILDIAKIRAFGRLIGQDMWFTFVPIMTLKPLTGVTIRHLLEILTSELHGQGRFDKLRVQHFIDSPPAQALLIQHVLGAIVGEHFLRQLSEALTTSIVIGFQEREAARHLGTWLVEDLQTIAESAYGVFWNSRCSLQIGSVGVSLASLPKKVEEVTKRDLNIRYEGQPSEDASPEALASRNALTDMARLFIDLYRRYELPAREEVRQHGANIFKVPAEKASHRNRLEQGIAWNTIVEHICAQYRLNPSAHLSALLSLVLDYLNDLGISVPIMCWQEGVLFRAYRYGEDVLFMDQECELVYRAMEAFLKASERASIPRLTFEKIIVALIRIGIAKRFLQVIYGPTGTDGVARIGYYLHGAIPFLPHQPDEYFAEQKDSWLSSYLVDRGIFRIDQANHNEYSLGELAEGNMINSVARSEARQLGTLFGILSPKASSLSPKGAALSTNDLILLTTCVSPKDTTAALAAEIGITVRWYERSVAPLLHKLDLANTESVEHALHIIIGVGYIALHSAKLKYLGYKKGAPADINRKCSEYLSGTSNNGPFLAEHWDASWNAVLSEVTAHERQVFDPWLQRIIHTVYEMALLVFSMELGLQACRIAGRGNLPDDTYKEVCEKIAAYLTELKPYQDQIAGWALKLESRLLEIVTARTQGVKGAEAIKFSADHLGANIGIYVGLVDGVKKLLTEYKHKGESHSYSYLIWYDIFDSKGNKSGLGSRALDEYRETIKEFKKAINKEARGLDIRARKQRAEIYASKNTASSLDDEKHFFISGHNAIRWGTVIVKTLLQLAEVYKPIKLRILAIPCNFAGSSAYRVRTQADVNGQTFWEHLSLLQKNLKQIEESEFQGKTESLLFVGTDQLIRRVADDAPFRWEAVVNKILTTNVAHQEIHTRIRAGVANMI
ncbi:MAG: hypothetical protein ACYDHY_14385 [Acidiferrobacterales bacterium]